MVVVPVPVTKSLVTSMVAMVESSDVFLMVMLPDSTSTASLKVSTMLLSTPTLVALSAGDEEDSVGQVSAANPSSVIVQLYVEIIFALAVSAAPQLYRLLPPLKVTLSCSSNKSQPIKRAS